MPIYLQNSNPQYLSQTQKVPSIVTKVNNDIPVQIQLSAYEFLAYDGRSLYYDENPMMGNNGELRFVVQFGANLTDHLVQIFLSLSPKYGFEFGFYENPTGVSSGTPQSLVNLNRFYPDDVIDVTLLRDPTVGGNGDELMYVIEDTEAKGNDQIPGQGGNADFILNGNLDYHMYFKSLAADNQWNLSIVVSDWADSISEATGTPVI